jgi:hypothetical protein
MQNLGFSKPGHRKSKKHKAPPPMIPTEIDAAGRRRYLQRVSCPEDPCPACGKKGRVGKGEMWHTVGREVVLSGRRSMVWTAPCCSKSCASAAAIGISL